MQGGTSRLVPHVGIGASGEQCGDGRRAAFRGGPGLRSPSPLAAAHVGVGASVNSLLYRYWIGGMTVPLFLKLNVPNG